MKAAPFRYVRAESLDEALSILSEHGDEVRILAGGQSLGAMLNMRIVTPAIVLDLTRISSLGRIDGQSTGALVRQRDALAHATLRKAVPLLAQALPHVGHYQTRNRGTLGGSVAHADPSAEIPLVIATLDGEVELRSKRRKRRLRASEFFRSALVTAREADEVITALHWPTSGHSSRSAFVEFAVREGDFAIVAVACAIDAQTGHLRLGFGGCGETPQIAERDRVDTSDATSIRAIVEDATKALEFRSDMLATAAYRKQLAGVLGRKVIAMALDREASHA